MTTIPIDNIPDKTRNTGKALIAAVPQSVSEPAQKAYDTLTGGIQWYVEKWEDVVHEARHMQKGAVESINLSDFLAGLPEAKVISDIPGRLRVRSKELKGQEELAHQGTEALDQMVGISGVNISALTGSLLVYFDKEQYESSAALLQSLSQA